MQKGKDMKQIQAQARINGILRGGTYDPEKNTFIYHAGLTEIIVQNANKLDAFKILQVSSGSLNNPDQQADAKSGR